MAATGNLFQNSWETRIGYYENQFVNTNFIGYINEVRIWNTARKQTDLRTFMNSSLPNPTTQPGLLAYYTFDNLTNKQGNPSWNGTLAGSAAVKATNPNCNFIADSCSIPVDVRTIINDYTEVLSYDACKNELTVTDASKYNPGDTVLMIQMKGAVIDTSNTSNFGTITNYRNAGNYEFNYVKSKTGNSIELKNVLTKQYDLPTGKVQLVRVPHYNSLTIYNTLTCLPWDGSKGGVLVLHVKDTINMLANIDVTGKGFKGGVGYNAVDNTLNCFQNDYNYPISRNRDAGMKGESITSISSDIICGKGSPAGGGGGGLGHNSGGGGGGNGGVGGFGGYQLEPCGNSPFDNRGIGGHALTYNTAANKIFMGSGGGAGQADNINNLPPGGGNGAGIIILVSNYLKSNSFKILSNGDDGPACSIPQSNDCHDGMGGGAAGGSVLLDINQFIGNTTIENKGGKGADMIGDVPLGGRIGAGGGGGGGLLFIKNNSLPATLTNINNGGVNGVLTKDGNSSWGATSGQNGVKLFNLKIPVDTIPFVSCANKNTPIGNVINSYTPVLGLNGCENKLTVEDASTFNTGDTVLIIQMKGAVIDSSNTSGFGTVTDYKNAGNYEFNYVKNRTGSIVELKNILTKKYDISKGKVQLVRVPYYHSATITSTLTCLPWDGKKGGILVLNVADSVILKAPINVSGKGFRGGNDPYSNPGPFYCNENQYYYPPNPDLSSEKGEGIAVISPDKSFGKGALANGGGGGNSHNSGGGGGSNVSPGGFGGYQFEYVPCNTTVPFDNRGIGGKSLTYNNTVNKIFLGGGGGAGHSNNPEAFQSKGGNGSGIVIVIANKMKSNNFKIRANGDNGAGCGRSESGCHEGMGGGGAGGTILLNIKSYADNLTVEAKGGKGADMTSIGNYRVGPGGGGGAGIAWFSGTGFPLKVLPVLTGGIRGVCTGYLNDPWGTTAGQIGKYLLNLKIPVDTLSFVSCGPVPVTLIRFETNVFNKQIKLNWSTENEDAIYNYIIERSFNGHTDFIKIGSVMANNNHVYSFTDNTAEVNKNYYYRLVIVEDNGTINYSEIKTAKIIEKIKFIVVYPNPSKGNILVRLNGCTGIAKFTVVNSIGQVILLKNETMLNNSPIKLKLDKQPKGVYWLKVQTDEERTIERIVIL